MHLGNLFLCLLWDMYTVTAEKFVVNRKIYAAHLVEIQIFFFRVLYIFQSSTSVEDLYYYFVFSPPCYWWSFWFFSCEKISHHFSYGLTKLQAAFDTKNNSALQMKGRWESIYVFPEIKLCSLLFSIKNYNDLFPNSYTHKYARDLYVYVFPGSVCLFCCSRICGAILGINKSLTDTWMWKLGLRPRNSQKRNA